MKKSILVLTAAIAIAMTGCKETPFINTPGDNHFNTDSIPVVVDPLPTPDPEGMDLPEGCITVNEAVNIAKKLGNKEVTKETYFIKGWVVGFNRPETFDTDFPIYGNDFVYLSARNDGKGEKQFYCYRMLGPYGVKYKDLESLVEGDFIVVRCKIQNYSGTYENDGAIWTMASNNAHFNEVFAEDLVPIDTIHATCAEAKAAALALSENNVPTRDIYVIEGYVQSAGYNATVSRGQQIFWIDDVQNGNKVFESYYCNVPNGTAVPIGAKVRLTGPIMRYNTTAEMKNGDVEIIEE